MNEQIRELAEQAGLGKERWNTTEQFNSFLAKFAESIVQECLIVLNKRYMGDLNREDMEVLRCVEDVERHFEGTWSK